MDDNGYPTKSEIRKIKKWPEDDFEGMCKFLQSIWYYSDYIKIHPDKINNRPILELHTGGWSGHEDIIEALQMNSKWWWMHWLSSRRGGHYEFQPIYQQKSLNNKIKSNVFSPMVTA